MSRNCWILFGALVLASVAHGPAADLLVTNLAGLADAAGRSGQQVTLRPGVYPLTDWLTPAAIAEKRKARDASFLTFAGSGNVFRLRGVTIDVDTKLRSALHMPPRTDDFVVTGAGNVIEGLSIREFGDGLSPGGAALSVRGRGNTIRECTLTVRGSHPYGYGDLFGKGGGDIVIGHLKKSGLHVTGDGTVLAGCTLHMQSFGHGIFLQENAANVLIENCVVVGAVRTTEDMLAETNGPAFKAGFRTVVRTRAGEKKVLPGYMKSLSEDGFRTYGEHTNLVIRNCTAKNMRGGFELRSRAGARVEHCTAIGNERGFWVSTAAQVVKCRGDAQFGPLLIVEGDRASVELELLPEESDRIVHALALVEGAGHRIALQASASGERTKPVPVLIGYGAPSMGEGMAPTPEHRARDVVLRNDTAMPVVVSPTATGGSIFTRGNVLENKGKGVAVSMLEARAP